MSKHELWELQQMQSLPLKAKVQMTITRIRAWVEEYGEDGVYIAFSGGLDSTILLHIARSIYPDLQATFSDTGLEFPEIRSFVKTFDNVEWIKPKISFKEVIQKYGYPFISKEVSECVDGARKYLKILTDRQTDRQKERKKEPPYRYWYNRVTGTGAYQKYQKRNASQVPIRNEQSPWNLQIMQQFNKNQGGVRQQVS